MNNPKLALIALTFILMGFSVFGQRTVENIPEKFLSPKDLYADQSVWERFITKDGERAFNTPWLVISDRDNNITYKKPSLKSKQKTKMNFGDYGYVTDVSSDGEWIKVVDAALSGNKIRKKYNDYGWVQKEKMLLWTSCIVSPTSYITRKGFLVNRTDHLIPGEAKENALVFKGPKSFDVRGKSEFYSLYFVLKKEGNRILLGKEQRILSRRFINQQLVGWVDATKVLEWNSGIAIEPNFTINGFRERNENKCKRLIGYSQRNAAIQHSENGIIERSKILWDEDPCFVKNNGLISKTNPRRFKGGVLRFPYLNTSNKVETGNYIRSGVIGDIGRRGLIELRDHEREPKIGGVDNLNNKAKNFDIFFIIEGSEFMNNHKDNIIQGISSFVYSIKENRKIGDLKIGFCIYRDKAEEVHYKMIEIVPLTNDHKYALKALRKIEFNNWRERDEYSVFYYGLKEGLTRAKFKKKGTTNIIISIGKFADYRVDNYRRKLASDKRTEETYLNVDEILDDFESLNIHFYSIQQEDVGSKASIYFAKQARNFLIEYSKRLYNKEYGHSNNEPPYINTISGQPQRLKVSNSSYPGFLELPGRGNIISKEFFEKTIKDIFQESLNFPNSDNLICGFGKLNNKEVKREENLKLYSDIYFPKEIVGSSYSPISYVKFMSRVDLRNYMRLLQEITKAEDKPYDEKKKALRNSLIQISKRFINEEAYNITVNELFNHILGAEEAGLWFFENESTFKISEIVDLSDLETDRFINRIMKKENRLYSIYNNPRYEFKYHTGDAVYYWIPFEDLF